MYDGIKALISDTETLDEDETETIFEDEQPQLGDPTTITIEPKTKATLFQFQAPKKKEEEKLPFYLEFRKQKLQNPFIKRRLIRIFGDKLKCTYTKYTKWINLVKALTFSLILVFLALLSIKLDDFIGSWPWVLIYFPLVVSMIPILILIVLFWLPTLNWPIIFYRWIFQDYVGWWTSWAYCFTIKGRFVQLLFGINFTFAFLCGFFSTVFPQMIPIWAPLTLHAAGFMFWTTTVTQFRYPSKRWFYIILLTLVSISLSLFCVLLFLKTFLFEQILWSLASIPFYFTIIFFNILMIKVNIDMNTTSICVNGLIWNVTYFIFHFIFVSGMILLILRLDNVIKVKFVIVFIPFFILAIIVNIYYYLKAFTNWIKRPVLKNPFTLIRGGMKNTSIEMNKYIV